MRSLEKTRSKLNNAIISGCSKEMILDISRHLDNLILKEMQAKNNKIHNKGQ